MNRMIQHGDRLAGVAFAAISAACFGTLGIFARFAYRAGIDANTLLLLRFTGAAVLMAVLLAARREPLPRGGILLRLIGMGALGYTFQSLCYMLAVQYASPGLVGLLLYLYPVLVAGLSVILLHEPLRKGKLFALFLALVGTVLTVRPQGGQMAGALFALGAALIYAVYILVGSQVMRQVSAIQSSTVIFASAAVSNAILSAIHGVQLPSSPAGWTAVGSIVIVSTIIPVVTFLASLQRIGPTNTSMISNLEPVVTVILSAWLLGEGLTTLSLVGGALILASALILTTGEMQAVRVSSSIANH